ncbi:MAG: HIT domain-containing protein [Thermofilum sp.]|jgi:ATP adenylyltransferase|nr:HIT domain-containing protein [Thermofilum sp.]
MDVLFAPWRMAYIEYAKVSREPGCFICEALESDDLERSLVLYKGRNFIVLMNKFPYNTGHLLIAPSRHVADFSQLSDEELLALSRALVRSIEVTRKAFSPDGFNIGVNLGRVAGAGLESHLHIHVVPRWNGDTNFMPVIADTKVIPEALKDTYRKLMRHVGIFRDI